MDFHPRARQLGASLVDVVATLAIVLIVIGQAGPDLRDLGQRHRLDGTSSQLKTDLALARSLAATRNETIHVAFAEGPTASCYVIHSGASGSCRCAPDGAPVCDGPAQALRTVRQSVQAGEPLVLANVDSMAFSAQHGTVTPAATVRVVAANGDERRSIINVMGRMRHCASGRAYPDLPRC